MFCARKPGLLLSTMRALDGLGLDIQQAVISCFNGFALDIFRAEVKLFFSRQRLRRFQINLSSLSSWLLLKRSMMKANIASLSAMQGRPGRPSRADQSNTLGFSWILRHALVLRRRRPTKPTCYRFQIANYANLINFSCQQLECIINGAFVASV